MSCSQVHRLQLQQEAEKSRVLQDALHVLAQEQYQLEKSLQGHRSPTPAMYDSDQDEFYDCADDEGQLCYPFKRFSLIKCD